MIRALYSVMENKSSLFVTFGKSALTTILNVFIFKPHLIWDLKHIYMDGKACVNRSFFFFRMKISAQAVCCGVALSRIK